MTDNIKSELIRWWQSMVLTNEELKEKGIIPASSGTQAILKRCESLEAVMLQDSFQQLWFKLPEEIRSRKKLEMIATIAGLLVYVRPNNNGGFSEVAGTLERDKPIVSEIRFKKLLVASTADELFRGLRRLLKQLNGQVNPGILISDLMVWFKQNNDLTIVLPRDRITLKWAMNYYQQVTKTK